MAATDKTKPSALETAEFDPRLREEVEAVFWLFEVVRSGKPLPIIEAAAVAHALYVSLRLDGKLTVPQLPLHGMAEYAAVHGINVALLGMGVAEMLNLEEAAVRAIGLAGLLHDIGMTRVPLELLSKSDQLTDEERASVMRHPIDGAEIIVSADSSLELPAIVAYEHHLKPDGTGYPTLTYGRRPHRVSKLIAVCDAYHALRSPRPFREPWPQDIVFSYLRERSGFDFDRELVSVLIEMMRRRNRRR